MEKREIKIMTRIMSQPNGSSILKLTVKNGWSFWNRFTVKDSKDLRDYLKSDEFKEYAYGIFSKYEGMTYKEMCDTDRKSDFQKIWDKLDGFAWRTDDERFKITVNLKLSKTYRDGFTYRVEYSNNKDNRRCWFKRFLSNGYMDKGLANMILDDFYCYLSKDKAFNDKLATYKTWDEFYANVSSDGFVDVMDSCLMDARLAA